MDASCPQCALVTYYRSRVSEQDKERTNLLNKINSLDQINVEKCNAERQLTQREDEVCGLQKTVSELQRALYEEKQLVTKLYGENDKLKVSEIDQERHIHSLQRHLHTLLDTPPLTTSTTSALTADKMAAADSKVAEVARLRQSNLLLASQVSSLRRQLHQLTTVHSPPPHGSTPRPYTDARCQQLSDALDVERSRVQAANDRLRDLQRLLHDTTETLVPRYKVGAGTVGSGSAGGGGGDSKRALDRLTTFPPPPVQAARDQAYECVRVCELYRAQLSCVEGEVRRLRGEVEAWRTSYQSSTEQLKHQLHVADIRYNKLDTRRHLEREGFRTDITFLNNKLRALQRKLLKAAEEFCLRESDIQLLADMCGGGGVRSGVGGGGGVVAGGGRGGRAVGSSKQRSAAAAHSRSKPEVDTGGMSEVKVKLRQLEHMLRHLPS